MRKKIRTKRAGIGTKFVILVLLVASITALLSLNTQLDAAKAERDAVSQTVQDQRERNAALANDIANCDDPEQIASIARDKLGLVGQDEIVFDDTSK
jgi:cell division protein FtsB